LSDIHFLGIICALNCIIPFFLYLLNGSIIGELVISNGKIRSFGFLTDQVGFALVYYLIYALNKRNYILVVFYTLAILVTGTRGAILVAALAFLITLIYKGKKDKKILKTTVLLLVPSVLITYFLFFTVNGLEFMNKFNL
jgi:hypothetical protein